MRYLFYPGCSADTSALEYKTATLAVLEALNVEVEEIADWTCCGASAAAVKSALLGLALPARNLALAERDREGRDVLTICSSCYTNLRRVEESAKKPATLARINAALEVEELSYQGRPLARHLLDILANDIGPERIAKRVVRPLTGLTVAPYYGCQTVRPFSPFDDPERPSSMNAILESLGVVVQRHGFEASCCGTSLAMTKPEIGVGMAARILGACEGADCIATVCPMCQMNLDCYQGRASSILGRRLSQPVLFLPQLMGLAFGLPESVLMLYRHVADTKPVLERLAQAEVVKE